MSQVPPSTLFAETPLLAVFTAIAAFIDLFYWRVFRLVVLSRMPADVIAGSWAVLVGPVALNLTVLGGVVALFAGLMDLLRSTHFAPVLRRTSLAAFLGIFGAALIALTFIPTERVGVPRVMVIVTIAAGGVLATLMSASALVHSMRGLWRATMLGALATSLFTVFTIALQHAPLLASLPFAEGAAKILRLIAEVAWLITPLLCAPAVLAEGTTTRVRLSYFFGFVAFMLAAFCMGIAKVSLRSHFADALYYTTRVELLVELAPLVYSPLFGITIGAGVAGLLGPSTARQQGGAGLVLWLCAGTMPPSPARMLMLVLATLLLVRGAISDQADASNQRSEAIAS